MTMTLRLTLLFASALFAIASVAGTAQLTWTNPTTNTDGSAIGPILQTRLEYGSCSGASFGTKSGEWTNAGSGASSTSPNLAAGTWCFRAYTKTASGESGPSNVATKAIAPPLPSPPTNLVASDLALVAYGISQTPDKMTVFPVGNVAPGTPCDGTTSANGLYRVPRASVTWAGSVMPPVVFAQCAGS